MIIGLGECWEIKSFYRIGSARIRIGRMTGDFLSKSVVVKDKAEPDEASFAPAAILNRKEQGQGHKEERKCLVDSRKEAHGLVLLPTFCGDHTMSLASSLWLLRRGEEENLEQGDFRLCI